jgi:3-dehydroquinate synthetase
VALLERFGLPTAPAPQWAWPALRAAMGLDKKAAGGQVRFVLGAELGRADLPEVVPEAELAAAWERWCACHR